MIRLQSSNKARIRLRLMRDEGVEQIANWIERHGADWRESLIRHLACDGRGFSDTVRLLTPGLLNELTIADVVCERMIRSSARAMGAER